MSALAVVAMMSLLMSGVCLLATSHADREQREADYSMAMQIAEAGINYEINYYAVNNTAHLSSAPYTGSVAGESGTFTVYSNSTNPTLISSSGTVGGIVRTVQVTVSGSSIFNGNYAVFGTTSVTLNSNTITGTVGSNVTVAGSPSSSSSSTCKVKSSCSDNYDTCTNICNKQFANGWSTLSSSTCVNNQCSHTMCLISSWQPYWNCLQPCTSVWSGSKSTCTDNQVNALPSGIVVLLPGDTNTSSSTHFTGDYYYSTCQLKNCTVYCDSNCNASASPSCPACSPGPCRIWCGGSDNTDDQLCTSFNCTSSQTSCQPRCFYDKPHTCTITQSSCTGGIYAVHCGKSGTTTHSSVVCSGCKNTQGTVIGDDVTLSSNTSGVAAANISHPTDPTSAAGFGYAGSWTEMLAPGAGKVFADGSNN